MFQETKGLVTSPGSRVHWIKLAIAVAGLIAFSFGFAALLQFIKVRLDLNLYQYETVACLSVFVSAFVANMTIIAPVPFAAAIMAAAAQDYNPVIVALVGANRRLSRRTQRIFCRTLGPKNRYPRQYNWVQAY